VDKALKARVQFSALFSIHNVLVAEVNRPFSAVLRFLPMHPGAMPQGWALTGAPLALITDSRPGFQHNLSVSPAWDTVPSLS